MSGATTALERLAILLASLVLSVGLIALLSGFFAGRDPAGVSGGTPAIGTHYPDLGHRHILPGQLRPPYNSVPPTSGAHVPEPILADGRVLNDDQILEALELGNVVVLYGTPAPPPGLRELAVSLGAGFSPALEAAGQALVIGRRPGTQGLVVLAWTRTLRVASPADPLLRIFAQEWLGRGAPGR